MKVRLYSHIGKRSGYGRAGCELAMSILAAGIDLEIIPIDTVTADEIRAALAPHHAQMLTPCLRSIATASSSCDAVIVHTLPADCQRVLDVAKVQCGTLIAYTTWEALTAPPDSMVMSLGYFDQVWVPSRATWKAMNIALDCRTVPHAFLPESLPGRRERRGDELAEDRPFRFYYIGAWNSRKNPGGILRAYAHQFRPGDDVELHMHCPGTPKDVLVAALASTGLTLQEMAPIAWSHAPIADDGILAMHGSADCFVSASRGEAWNLPAFDAMLAGRHVIVPIGQGSDDYLEETSATRYDFWESPAFADVHVGQSSGADGERGVAIKRVSAQGLTSRALWAEPDLRHLAEEMENAANLGWRTIRVDYDPAERFGYRAVGTLIRTNLEEAIA